MSTKSGHMSLMCVCMYLQQKIIILLFTTVKAQQDSVRGGRGLDIHSYVVLGFGVVRGLLGITKSQCEKIEKQNQKWVA